MKLKRAPRDIVNSFFCSFNSRKTVSDLNKVVRLDFHFPLNLLLSDWGQFDPKLKFDFAECVERSFCKLIMKFTFFWMHHSYDEVLNLRFR